jgi:tRNA (guanosine-2'-O-)-methyltransferase
MTSDRRSDPPIAVDRRTLAKEMPPKTSKWPRTDRRVARLTAALQNRQPDLTVVLENVHDMHNVSAVLRSCDAVGVQDVHLIYTVEELPQEAFARRIAAGAAKWIDTYRWESVAACYAVLRAEKKQIIATAFTDRAKKLYDFDLARPTALVFGNEMRGLTDDAVEQADHHLVIPMVGMVQSLNISVSCAVTLYEAYRQRAQAGAYEQPSYSESEISHRLDAWLKK